ncbi:MAG: hypothetical protein ABEJ42_04160 [Halobacteriaceae archaeon]
MRLVERLRVPTVHQVWVAAVLEVALAGFVVLGLYTRNVGVAVNSAVALLVTQLPPALERNYAIVMDPRLVLWLTAAVFLHALGTVPLPGLETLYRSVGWWDHLTHALSSSVVAGAGYAAVRALDEHVDGLELPPSFTFVTILVSVVAFGVLWEVLEFAIGLVASATGTRGILTQYGLEDSMLDLVFDLVGAVVVAAWGTAYLTDVITQLERYFEDRAGAQ